MLVMLLLLLLVVAGCSTQSSKNEQVEIEANGEAITVKDFVNREVRVDGVPEKIVTLGTGEMKIIHELGGNLVGIPTSKDIVIEDLKDAVQVGNTHGMDLEKIAALQPDVVIGDSIMNQKDLASIEGIGSQMIFTSANSIKDIQAQIELFGQLLQQEDKAKELIQKITDKVVEKQAHAGEKPRVLLIYGAPGTYMAALPNSLSGNMLEAVGGENIAADFPGLENYPQYAQLNTERIIQANPQFVFLMTHGDAAIVKEGFIKEMEQNPSWSNLDAVKDGKIEILPADLFGTNPGSQVTEALDVLHSMIHDAE